MDVGDLCCQRSPDAPTNWTALATGARGLKEGHHRLCISRALKAKYSVRTLLPGFTTPNSSGEPLQTKG